MAAGAALSPAHANSKYAALVIHADTGDILFDRYSTQKRYPASLTKMMTLYMLFDELEKGNVTLDTKLKVSRNAASMPASKLGVSSGSTITVEDAIHALIIKSANDVAVVVAEQIGGSESRFAGMMTDKAYSMGMRSTTFRNASGLPNSRQVTTARDMAVLSQRVVQDFPQYYHFFDEHSFTWKGKTIKGHNDVAEEFDGADGLKTGYTRMSGYNLATSAKRGDNRLIGIVLGGRSGYTRNAHMEKILDNAFEAIEGKPELISAVFRQPPEPKLKPTTLAELGGVWPKSDNEGIDTEALSVLAAKVDALGSDELNSELVARAASGDWKTAAKPGDDLGKLIVESDKDGATEQRFAKAESDIGEGDIDYDSLTPDRRWTIQTGAYRDLGLASTRMFDTKSLIDDISPVAINELTETSSAGKKIYRIRFNGLTENEARNACKVVIDEGGDCFTMRNPKMSNS